MLTSENCAEPQEAWPQWHRHGRGSAAPHWGWEWRRAGLTSSATTEAHIQFFETALPAIYPIDELWSAGKGKSC